MDIETLLKELRRAERYCLNDYSRMAGDAVIALSTLRAENAQLRESQDHWKRLAHELSEGVNGKDAEHERLQAENEKLRAELERVKKKNKYSAHDVALILSDAFGDSCACNFNGNDEWLPEKCELLDTCPDVVGVACWEQYLKWLGQKED